MFCLRGRVTPSLRSSLSSLNPPVNRITPVTQKTPTNPSALTSRPFSSLLSTPTRLQPSHPVSRLPTSTPAAIASAVSSLLAQQPQQTRSFSATASLGVRRVTFRPSRRVQKRRHGFLSRNKARKGRQTLERRRLKGRKAMSW
ncbi:hypothetical protein N7492_005081 [Penicillium capsulatum]|uniref:Ribosomal protein L34 n=1 Tax=Penicillium capsulatum TaxID=69766 RepID=A0A9W9IBA1_9EURO|nr:hypothetical protein N7492_005081 [Penicillium capsulatum]KAJ6135811.1 hypothetical protein N7512_000971 [Penicillium capsulatum]